MRTEEIISLFQQEHSIKQVAYKLKISESVIRRTLITNNIYPTNKSTMIHQMLLSGISVETIANRFHISTKTVKNYTPYTKGSYVLNSEPSKNAIRIRKHRMNKALQK